MVAVPDRGGQRRQRQGWRLGAKAMLASIVMLAPGGVVAIHHQARAIDPHVRSGRNGLADDIVVGAGGGVVQRTARRQGVARRLGGDVVMQRGGGGFDAVVRAMHDHRDAGLIDRQPEHRLVVADDGGIHRVFFRLEAQRLVLGHGRDRGAHVHRLHGGVGKLQDLRVLSQELLRRLLRRNRLRRDGPGVHRHDRRRGAFPGETEIPGMPFIVIDNLAAVSHLILAMHNGLLRSPVIISARYNHNPESRTDCAPLHSITSSARASRDGGIVSPSALAVLRLSTSSYRVGACTGRSAGFSSLRMRFT